MRAKSIRTHFTTLFYKETSFFLESKQYVVIVVLTSIYSPLSFCTDSLCTVCFLQNSPMTYVFPCFHFAKHSRVFPRQILSPPLMCNPETLSTREANVEASLVLREEGIPREVWDYV